MEAQFTRHLLQGLVARHSTVTLLLDWQGIRIETTGRLEYGPQCGLPGSRFYVMVHDDDFHTKTAFLPEHVQTIDPATNTIVLFPDNDDGQ